MCSNLMFCDHIQQMVCCLHKPNIKELPNPTPADYLHIYLHCINSFTGYSPFWSYLSLVSTLCVSVFSLRYF